MGTGKKKKEREEKYGLTFEVSRFRWFFSEDIFLFRWGWFLGLEREGLVFQRRMVPDRKESIVLQDRDFEILIWLLDQKFSDLEVSEKAARNEERLSLIDSAAYAKKLAGATEEADI